MTKATEPFPILVGVTGNRTFADDPGTNEELRKSVRSRLDETFQYINKKLPNSPKVLLTGGAYGADLLAADAAVAAGPEWSVAVILPYDARLFEKDFVLPPCRPGDTADHPDLAVLRTLMAQSTDDGGGRAIVRVLPRLKNAQGSPATDEQLDRESADQDKALRREHYEQVGQFIAETAMLLIAVMDRDKQPNRNAADGGSARVVAARRCGRPDDVGADVARRSIAVRNSWNRLLAPAGGYVWLIDPHEATSQSSPPFTVLPPLLDKSAEEVFADYPGRAMPHGHKPRSEVLRTIVAASAGAAGSGLLRRLASRTLRPDWLLLHESIHPLLSFDHFEALKRKAPKNASAPMGKASGPASLGLIEDPVSYLADLRGLIRWPQGHLKGLSERAFLVVSILFVSAVLALEIFAKFAPKSTFLLPAYVLSLIVIVGIVFFARLMLWQLRSEDYRAASEMLRVQRAWWAAGLTDRVDRVHLQGADAGLARPRDAVRSVLGWIALRSDWLTAAPIPANWDVVRPGGLQEPRNTQELAEGKPKDWVGEQIGYYARNHGLREDTASKSDTLTWLFFAISLVLAFIVCLGLASDGLSWDAQEWLAHLSGASEDELAPRWSVATWLLILLVFGLLRWRLWEVQGMPAMILTALTALICGLALAVILRALGQPLGAFLSKSAAETAERLSVVVFVVLTATAGAIRFHAEKRGFEAEAFAYHDALDKFERAECALAALAPLSQDTNCEEAARKLVRNLGELALRENETWLKAHRERPLNPIVG